MHELRRRVVPTTTYKPKPRRFKPKGFLAKTTVLSYKRRYSRKALQTLVKSRSGLYPEKEQVKAVYARILVDLDEKSPRFSEGFQFLDLPPELRNCVYEELLILLDGLVDYKAGAFPAILSTNKQIYSEAVGILYGANTGAAVHELVQNGKARMPAVGWRCVIAAMGTGCCIVEQLVHDFTLYVSTKHLYASSLSVAGINQHRVCIFNGHSRSK